MITIGNVIRTPETQVLYKTPINNSKDGAKTNAISAVPLRWISQLNIKNIAIGNANIPKQNAISS